MPNHPRLDVADGKLVGAIVSESLRPGSSIDGLGLRLLRLARYDITEPAPGQPSRWTLIEFDGDAAVADDLARHLSQSLLDEGGWYANFSTSDEVFVVYAERIFRYSRDDPSNADRRAAEDHGRAQGVPEPQLDWSE